MHASDLGGGSVLHEVVEGDAAVAADPGGGVGKAGRDVLADTVERDLPGNFGVQQILRSDLDFRTEVVVLYIAKVINILSCLGSSVEWKATNLVGTEHVSVENLARDGVDEGVGNPGAVVAGGDFTKLVGADLGHRDFIGLGVVLDGDLSGHASHGSNLTPVT